MDCYRKWFLSLYKHVIYIKHIIQDWQDIQVKDNCLTIQARNIFDRTCPMTFLELLETSAIPPKLNPSIKDYSPTPFSEAPSNDIYHNRYSGSTPVHAKR